MSANMTTGSECMRPLRHRQHFSWKDFTALHVAQRNGHFYNIAAVFYSWRVLGWEIALLPWWIALLWGALRYCSHGDGVAPPALDYLRSCSCPLTCRTYLRTLLGYTSDNLYFLYCHAKLNFEFLSKDIPVILQKAQPTVECFKGFLSALYKSQLK